MKTTGAILLPLLASYVAGHGLVTSIQGANGVQMPGLSVADGTPRDCSSNGCGSQADTSIIRDRTMSASPLGVTQGNGPVDASVMISNFMGTGAVAPKNKGAASSAGVEDAIPQGKGTGRGNRNNAARSSQSYARQLLGGLFGGGAGAGQKTSVAAETMVASTAGLGSSEGLPTCSDDGSITMTFRQINQDGAGPLTAAVDGTSGGKDASAFKTAQVTKDVPGLGVQGLSLATNTDFPLTVQMPAGMTCDASVGGADNVCIVRVRNGAAAGPFGGSAAFTQTAAQRKRAIEYRRKMKRGQAKDFTA